MGKSVIGILLYSGTWEISYKHSSLFAINLQWGKLEKNLEVSVFVKDELAIVLSLGKNCLPKTWQDNNANSKLIHPQGDYGKLDSLELLKSILLSVLFDYQIQCSNVLGHM